MDSETKTQERANALISITKVYFYRFKMHTLTHDILKVSQVLLLVLHMIPVPGIKGNKQAQKITGAGIAQWLERRTRD